MNRCPAYGFYQDFAEEDVLARIDWVILNRYLAIEYDQRLPLLVYTPRGWEMEKETYASELLRGFDEILATGRPPFDLSYLKDRRRDLIWLLLDKVEASRNRKYIPLLEAWAQVDYTKVKQRIQGVVRQLEPRTA